MNNKITYSDPRDLSTIEKAINYNIWLFTGINDQRLINEIKKRFLNTIEKVEVLPYGTLNDYVSPNAPGICSNQFDDNTIVKENIIMYGFKNSNKNNYLFTIQEFIHEFAHAFSNFLPTIMPNYKKSRKVKVLSKEEYNEYFLCGCITYDDGKGKNSEVGNMFCETFIDMISVASLMTFEPLFPRNGVNLDTVFKKHVDSWGSEKTGYSVFTSLTRLMIAAFSNDPFLSYQNVVDQGRGIYNITRNIKNGSTILSNDFIYGMMCSPIHIEEKFDRYMGQGKYFELCSRMDKVFKEFLNNGYRYTDKMISEIKWFMTILSNYVNIKKKIYLNSGVFNIYEANKYIDNYNIIWNTLQREYRSYFSEADINNIIKEAAKPPRIDLTREKNINLNENPSIVIRRN